MNQAARGSPSEIGLQPMIGSFSRTHLNVLNGNIPATMSTMSAVDTPQNYLARDGQIVCLLPANIYSAQTAQAAYPTEGGYAHIPGISYYPSYMPGNFVIPYTPVREEYMGDRQGATRKVMPGLENYCESESAPETPSLQIPLNIDLLQTREPVPYNAISANYNIDALTQKRLTIPHAVPAVFTPRENMKTLEQSLSNPIIGNCNVYIRGLHPNTNDETLAVYTALFGRVETSKAIIDTATGACKGFGFAKYFNIYDSEMCIRGFYELGYEVGFAKESFNSRLKVKGDPRSTNLYVSNLPKNMKEIEFAAIFVDYDVASSRILYDSQGNNCGAGFARFESRQICDKIIKLFHGHPIGEEGLLLQVRYADTPAQKNLKKITAVRRQFRTAEYNVSVFGSAVDTANLSHTMKFP